MKKILISTILAAFFAFSASADTNIGVSISVANMDATGTHTPNQGGTVAHAANADFEVASFFVEKEVDLGPISVAIGVDLIPMTAEVDKIGGGTGFDATVEVGNLMTGYVQPMFDAGGMTLFLKAGASSADLEITNISRQVTATETSDSASTDGAQSKTLNGIMYGVGMQTDMAGGFLRFEGTVTEFDTISHTNSNDKTLKADSELTRFTISYGKSF